MVIWKGDIAENIGRVGENIEVVDRYRESDGGNQRSGKIDELCTPGMTGVTWSVHLAPFHTCASKPYKCTNNLVDFPLSSECKK